MTVPRGHKMSDAEFRAAHARGLTTRQVAELDGTWETAVSKRARRLGIKFCNKPGVKPKTELHGPAREMRREGKSYGEIAAALGCSPSAAWWWCQ